MKKKIFLVIVFYLFAFITYNWVYADNTISISGGSASSAVILTVEPVVLQYTAPIRLYFAKENGVYTIVSNSYITNNSLAPIVLEKVILTSADNIKHEIIVNEIIAENSQFNLVDSSICSVVNTLNPNLLTFEIECVINF